MLTLAGFEARLSARGERDSSYDRRGGRLSATETTFARARIGLESERALGGARLVTRSSLAVDMGSDLPPQEFVYLGGPTTAPGYDFHELVGRFGASQRIEGRFPVPFAAFSLGRYGNTGRTATLAPFAQTAYIARVEPSVVGDRRRRLVPVGWPRATDRVRPASVRCRERIA